MTYAHQLIPDSTRTESVCQCLKFDSNRATFCCMPLFMWHSRILQQLGYSMTLTCFTATNEVQHMNPIHCQEY